MRSIKSGREQCLSFSSDVRVPTLGNEVSTESGSDRVAAYCKIEMPELLPGRYRSRY